MIRIGALVMLVGMLAMAPAAELPSRGPIREIVIKNLGRVPLDAGFVRSHVRSAEGQDLDPAQISRDLKDLLETRAFSYVSVELESAENGLRLVYVVQGRPRLASPVRILGNKKFSERTIRKHLELEPGDRVDDQILGTKAKKIEEAYREAGLPEAHVSWTITEEQSSPGFASVTFSIDEGEKVRLADFVFSGNVQLSSKLLEKAAREPQRERAFWWLRRKPRYDENEVEAARRAIQDAYLRRGFLDVVVKVREVSRDRRNNAVVHIAVEEGPIYRWGVIGIEGVTRFPSNEIMRLVGIKTGEIAVSAALEQSVQAIQDFYGMRGFARAVVKPLLDARPDEGVADVRLVVTEGDLIRIGNILIRGNTRTRDKVIRRELLVHPGEILDAVKARISERRLANLGYFSHVRRYTLGTAEPDREDLVFEVEEKSTGQFMVGAGFSSVENFMAYVELAQGNFDLLNWPHLTGGGQKLKVRTQIGSRSKNYELSFVEPWLFDRKLSFGVDLYRRDVKYGDYELERTGVALTLGKALPGPNRLNVSYSLERSLIKDVADTNEYIYAEAYARTPGETYYFQSEEKRTMSELRVTLLHDTRDNPFIPTRGNRTAVFAAVAGGPLGFDTDIYRLGLRTSQYVRLWLGHVLSLRMRYEIVDSYGDTDEVPLSERLFVGGGQTIRGFDYRDVGPKVLPAYAPLSGRYRPAGGQSLATANVEYIIPIISGIRLAAFYDTGNVWRDPYELDLSGLAASAGIGIRFDIPGFPIRVDRAWAVRRDDELTDLDPWVVWIGYEY